MDGVGIATVILYSEEWDSSWTGSVAWQCHVWLLCDGIGSEWHDVVSHVWLLHIGEWWDTCGSHLEGREGPCWEFWRAMLGHVGYVTVEC